MRFSCDGRDYNTDGMPMVATGDAYMPMVFFTDGYAEALAVVQTRDGVSARKATVEELRRLHERSPHVHFAEFLTRRN